MQQHPDRSPEATNEGPAPSPDRPEQQDEVLLALVDLARDQARELARQNEELRRQNEELARANRHTSEFLTTMTHELRTPLNAILGFSELLQEEIAGALTPGQAEYVTDIRRAGQNLLSMVNDLLDMAKIESGQMDVRRELLDLRAPVTQASDIVRAMALRQGQTLEVRAGDQVACLGDVQRIRQIALNLLSNAVKFTPQGGRVVATVRAVEGGAELEVRDSGIGIDPAHHALIFEAFRQIDAGETRGYQGTGLGLALVARFTQALGGTVRVDSTLGHGATFTVRLPLPADDAAQGPRVGLLGHATGGQELRRQLQARGVAVDELAPADAFALRENTRAVLLDLADPADALRAVRRVQQLRARMPPATLVLLPATAQEGDALRAAGAEIFSGDPSPLYEVLARLHTLGREASP